MNSNIQFIPKTNELNKSLTVDFTRIGNNFNEKYDKENISEIFLVNLEERFICKKLLNLNDSLQEITFLIKAELPFEFSFVDNQGEIINSNQLEIRDYILRDITLKSGILLYVNLITNRIDDQININYIKCENDNKIKSEYFDFLLKDNDQNLKQNLFKDEKDLKLISRKNTIKKSNRVKLFKRGINHMNIKLPSINYNDFENYTFYQHLYFCKKFFITYCKLTKSEIKNRLRNKPLTKELLLKSALYSNIRENHRKGTMMDIFKKFGIKYNHSLTREGNIDELVDNVYPKVKHLFFEIL